MVINHKLLVKLLPKEMNIGGVKAEFNLETGKLKTENLDLLFTTTQTNDNPAYFCLTEGVVLESNSKEILVGDKVHLEFFGVTTCLGRWYEPKGTGNDACFILNGKFNNISTYPQYAHLTGLNILIHERYVYWVERNGENIAVNNNSIIREHLVEASSVIEVSQKVRNGMATVLIGPHKGEVIVYKKDLVLGRSQNLILNGEPVSVLNNEYVYATVETTNTNEQ